MPSLAIRGLALAAVAGLAIVLAIVLLAGGGDGGADGAGSAADPLGFTSARERELADAAARGNAHVLYAKLPGGARESAERTARWRPQVEEAAATAGIDPDELEGLVLLESAGRDDAIADPRLEGAVGLTQILAETGRNLLQMQVDPAAARRLSRSLRRAEAGGDAALIARLRARRMRVDERFDPPRRSQATARYLLIAKRELGDRDDLAVVSYHMGIGNLQNALRAYGDDDASYARLYFDSTPLRHAPAYRRLAALGDDSSTTSGGSPRPARSCACTAPTRSSSIAPRSCRTPRTPPRRCCTPPTRPSTSKRPSSCGPRATPAGSSRCRRPS